MSTIITILIIVGGLILSLLLCAWLAYETVKYTKSTNKTSITFSFLFTTALYWISSALFAFSFIGWFLGF